MIWEEREGAQITKHSRKRKKWKAVLNKSRQLITTVNIFHISQLSHVVMNIMGGGTSRVSFKSQVELTCIRASLSFVVLANSSLQ